MKEFYNYFILQVHFSRYFQAKLLMQVY